MRLSAYTNTLTFTILTICSVAMHALFSQPAAQTRSPGFDSWQYAKGKTERFYRMIK